MITTTMSKYYLLLIMVICFYGCRKKVDQPQKPLVPEQTEPPALAIKQGKKLIFQDKLLP